MTLDEAVEKLSSALTSPIPLSYATQRPQWAPYLADDGTIRGLTRLECVTQEALWLEDEDGQPYEVEASVTVFCPSLHSTTMARLFTVAEIAAAEPGLLGLQYFIDWARAHDRAQERLKYNKQGVA